MVGRGEASCTGIPHWLRNAYSFPGSGKVIGEKVSKGSSPKGLPGEGRGKKTSEKRTECVTLDNQVHKKEV